MALHSVDKQLMFAPDPLGRVAASMEMVKQRLKRVTTILDDAEILYAVIGGNAVAAVVGAVNPSAVRGTVDVDLIIRRSDLDRVRAVLEGAGYIYKHKAGIDFFLEKAGDRFMDAVHLIFDQEKVRDDYVLPAPSVEERVRAADGFYILSFPALVRMKLTSFRPKDQTHLIDLAGLGILKQEMLESLDEPLRSRLQQIFEDPDAQLPLE